MTAYRIETYGYKGEIVYIIKKKVGVFWIAISHYDFGVFDSPRMFNTIDSAEEHIRHLLEKEKRSLVAKKGQGKIIKTIRG